jgi:hypothetical protein
LRFLRKNNTIFAVGRRSPMMISTVHFSFRKAPVLPAQKLLFKSRREPGRPLEI